MFSDLLKYAMSILIFKAFHNLLPVNYKISVGEKNMFSIKFSRTNLRRQCTSNVGIRLLNDLPVNLRKYVFQKEHEVQFFAMLLSCGDKVYCVNYYYCVFLLIRCIMYSPFSFLFDMLYACSRPLITLCMRPLV